LYVLAYSIILEGGPGLRFRTPI